MINDIQLTTPALLFSTVSLVMLAYTNRFLALAKLIRDLHDKYVQTSDELTCRQIHLLHKRVKLVKHMQLLCICALLLSVVSMLLIAYELPVLGAYSFIIGLLLMSGSLGYSVYEISLSTQALSLVLQDMELRPERTGTISVTRIWLIVRSKILLKGAASAR